ncbi:MAG: DUF6088 family protein [Prevotella sp.]|nr:DUF6088 family protein [Prevotella sp.]
MIIRDIVKREIGCLPEGVVVSASDFDVPRQYRATLIKALNQFEYAGEIKRISKGRYYKPRKSIFGELFPSEKEIVKDFLEKDGNTIGYITGTRAFASLALTTQVSSVIMVGTNVSRRPLSRGQYKITFLLQPNRINNKDIPLLILLDALRLIKEIPGTTPDETIKQIIIWIKELSDTDKTRLLRLCRAYKPYVRAQLGAIFDYLGFPTYDYIETLNPLSRYKLGISSTVLPTTKNWNIV